VLIERFKCLDVVITTIIAFMFKREVNELLKLYHSNRLDQQGDYQYSQPSHQEAYL
jgi:hypothetical protein